MTREEVLEAQLGEARDRIRVLEGEATIREEALASVRAERDLARAACAELRARLQIGGAP